MSIDAGLFKLNLSSPIEPFTFRWILCVCLCGLFFLFYSFYLLLLHDFFLLLIQNNMKPTEYTHTCTINLHFSSRLLLNIYYVLLFFSLSFSLFPFLALVFWICIISLPKRLQIHLNENKCNQIVKRNFSKRKKKNKIITLTTIKKMKTKAKSKTQQNNTLHGHTKNLLSSFRSLWKFTFFFFCVVIVYVCVICRRPSPSSSSSSKNLWI